MFTKLHATALLWTDAQEFLIGGRRPNRCGVFLEVLVDFSWTSENLRHIPSVPLIWKPCHLQTLSKLGAKMTWDLCKRFMFLECLGHHDELLSRNSAAMQDSIHCFWSILWTSIDYNSNMYSVFKKSWKQSFETFESFHSSTPLSLVALLLHLARRVVAVKHLDLGLAEGVGSVA